MSNLNKMSTRMRWLVGSLVVLLTFGAVALTQDSGLFKGMLRGGDQGYSREQCIEYKAVWDKGNWTATNPSNQKPAACKEQYPELWNYDGDLYTFEQCTEYKALWDQGNWTQGITFSLDKPYGCKILYPEMWNPPTREACELVEAAWGIGNWSAPISEDVEACRDAFPDINLDGLDEADCAEVRAQYTAGDWTARHPNNGSGGICAQRFPDVWNPPAQAPSPERCDELQGLWNEGGWTDRFGTVNEPMACDTAYGFDFSGPSAAECRAARELWGTIDWTERFGHAGLAADCDRYQSAVWHVDQPGVVEPVRRGEPGAGFEDEVEVNGNPFSDVDANSREGRAAVALFHRGIIGGYPDGTFRADNFVNRAEVVKFVVLALGLDVPAQVDARDIGFWDVPVDSWYAPYVVAARDAHIIAGYADGSFGGGNEVNTAEFLMIITRSFDFEDNYPMNYRDVEPGVFYEQAAGVADWFNLFPERGDELRPADNVSRGEAAYVFYQLLVDGIWR